MARSGRLFIACTLCLALISSIASANPLAFEGAEGFGASATGGRGGEVYHVANLNDAGPGSFREAVSKSKRIVVFDVSGYIHIKSGIHIESDITIAGQSAPGDGIGIYGDFVSLSDSHNVIVRYLRLREGLNASKGKSSLMITRGKNMIFDHVSIEWGRWDCADINECQGITIQNSIIGQGIAPQRFGCLCQSDDITFSHCLWIDNQSRNPKAKGRIQYVNNVVYNWGVTAFVGGHSAGDHFADMVNNYFIMGPSSGKGRFAGEFKSTDHLYETGNMINLNTNGRLNGRLIQPSDFGAGDDAPTLIAQSTMTSPYVLTIDSVEEAYAKVIGGVGCSLHRDAVDKRLIDEVMSLGSGQIIDDPKQAGGIGELKNGPPIIQPGDDPIPDTWKTAHHIVLNNPEAYRELDPAGRMILEDYLNDLAMPDPAAR